MTCSEATPTATTGPATTAQPWTLSHGHSAKASSMGWTRRGTRSREIWSRGVAATGAAQPWTLAQARGRRTAQPGALGPRPQGGQRRRRMASPARMLAQARGRRTAQPGALGPRGQRQRRSRSLCSWTRMLSRPCHGPAGAG